MSLTLEENHRYQRHIMLDEIGEMGQLKLKKAKVLCIGAGGLASPALYYLAAAGIGTLGIIDNDTVDLSNLQRQILYTIDDVGKKKVIQAKERLLSLNPTIHIETYDTLLHHDNALNIISAYDIIIDATDNFATRYLINDACFQLQKPFIYAGIHQFEGQVALFEPPLSTCYRCLYPAPPPSGLMQNCADAGVLGILPGLLGSLQATLAIKYILTLGELPKNQLISVSLLTMQFKQYSMVKDSNCLICQHHHDFDHLPFHQMQSCEISPVITVSELKKLIDKQEDFYLLDVRQVEEYQQHHIAQSQLIPLPHLESELHQLPRDKMVIIYCRTDHRSQHALLQLKQVGFDKVRYLKGGMMAWEAWHQQGNT